MEMPKMPKPIEPHEWDRDPASRLLSWSLCGPTFTTGDQAELEQVLHEMAAAGLVDFRRPEPRDFDEHGHKVPKAVAEHWVVFPTAAGQSLGLALAHSADLLQMLDLHARMLLVGAGWAGVPALRLVVELDLRAGGSGEVPSWRAWFRGTTRESLRSLPRRHGLDREGVALA